MADPISLERPPTGKRYDPTAIDATGATLGHVLTAVSDGSGGKRAGYAAVSGGVSDGDKGDITVSSSGAVWTIDADAVSFSKIQNIATARVLGRTTGGSGDIEELSAGTGITIAGGTISAAAGSGGAGVAKYTKWDADVPDASPHSLNAEFDSSSLGSFTVVNSRGTIDADTSAKGKLFMLLPTQQFRMVAYLKALPGDTNWTVHTKVWVGAIGGGSLLTLAGIIISDTNTTNTGSQTGVAFGMNGVSESVRGTETWSNFGETGAGAGFSPNPLGGHHCYIRVRKQSGTYYAGFSGDGETWLEYTFTLFNGITPAYIGLYSQNYSTFDSQTTFEYFRYYANGTQTRTGGAVTVYG